VNKGLHEANSGATPVNTDHKPLVGAFFLIRSIKARLLKKMMPVSSGVLETNCFRCLLLIEMCPYKHNAELSRKGNITEENIRKSLIYLLSHGYIKTSPHARLVHPLNAYMFDTTYAITVSGKRLIRAVFEAAGIIKLAIDGN